MVQISDETGTSSKSQLIGSVCALRRNNAAAAQRPNRIRDRLRSIARVSTVSVFFLLLPCWSLGENHPSVRGRNAKCTLCHADLLIGKSVHSSGELSCTLCHAAREESSTVQMVLTVPREQLCFACHERSAMEQHWAMGQKACLDCHDAHRSARAMLLRRSVDVLQNP